MEVELIRAEDDKMGPRGGITGDGGKDSTSCGEIDEFGNSLTQDGEGISPEPHVGMEFDSETASRTFYEDYARRVGFSPRADPHQSKPDGPATYCEFLCSRKRVGESCEAMLRVEPRLENKWVVVRFVKEHSHAILTQSKLHCLRPKRHFVPRGVMHVSMDELHRTVKNTKRTLGRDAQNLLDYFQKMQADNPGFYYAIQLDEENRMSNAFWADARSRAAYRHFGDSVVFDTSYSVNQYKVPFAPFTGVNHHGQTIIFGCGLLLDESESTFVWLFKTFLASMNKRGPVSLTTDFNASIQTAAMQVFPEARHCFNKWHILREGRERMACVCLSHPNFQSELCNCINTTVTVEEFESFWQLIVEKYDLKRNDWFNSIHKVRTQWVPVYFRDSFFAAFPSLGPESSFFDGYVNRETTLPLFFRQYERALENSFEREADADFDTMCTTPVLKTPSPMEKQAANLYTKWVFSRFQEELVETFVYTANRVAGDGHMSTYRVVKFEDERKAYFVSLDILEMKANCTCKMFEYSGILCRHILTVFTVTNVLTLPSHYILNRWTKNAKNSTNFDHSGLQGHESLTMRYNNLCKEGIRFAEQGAASLETYNTSLFSLREGGKKVACVKKCVAEVVPSRSRVSGVGYDDQRISVGNLEMTPVLWPRQDEIIRRFNPNDVNVPSGPDFYSNAPRVGLVSLKRNGGHTDNMPVLPCLKSMTWVMENKNSTPANRVAVMNLKLQDYGKTPMGESEIKFSLSRGTLEPMLRSMAYINEQLSTPASKVAVINLKRQDTETTSGESEVKFQVSRDTLGAMLRSMAYIREQLSNTVERKQDNPAKRLRK